MTTPWRNDHLDDNDPRDIWYPAASWEEANLEGSPNGDGTHSIVLDLDGPHEYRPSTTPGHGHLIIPASLTTARYLDLLTALADAGVITENSLRHAYRRGATFVRKAGVYKPPGASSSEEAAVQAMRRGDNPKAAA